MPPLTIEEDEGRIFILAGRIYGRASGPLVQLAKEFVQPESALPHDGRFVFAVYDKNTGLFRAWADKYRLLGAFLVCNDDGFTFANDYWSESSIFDRAKVDLGAVMDLLLFGYVLPPRTLYTNAQMLAGYTEATDGVFTQHDWREHWPVAVAPGARDAAADLYAAMRLSAAELVRNWRPNVFRMSGGADTRLVASVLGKAELEQLDFQVVCAPYLRLDEDRDVIGAQSLADALGVPLKILQLPPEQSAFFAGLDTDARALSGLYGGEFLGGAMFSEEDVGVAVEPKQALDVVNELLVDPQLAQEAHERFARAVAKFGSRRLLTSVYLGTFRSSIYRSILYGWTHPSGLGQVALSPFSERRFLDRLLLIPQEQIVGYQLYGEIVRRHMPQALRDLPFASPITRFHRDLTSIQAGRDPKFRPPVSETLEPGPLTRLQSLFLERGLDWAHTPTEPALLLRLHNLQNGFLSTGSI